MDIIFEDEQIVVCIKPVGLSSEAGPNSVPEALGGNVFPVHRLDLNVGGIMVYAKTRSAAAKLSAAIEKDRMIKEYVAVVHGRPAPDQGILEDLLLKDSRVNKVFVVKRERKGVKKAKLSYQVIASHESTSLVLIRLYTGRSHQIRVQFASRGMPLVGDHKYGSRDAAQCPALRCCRLTFPHPVTGKVMQFTAPAEALAGYDLPRELPVISRI